MSNEPKKLNPPVIYVEDSGFTPEIVTQKEAEESWTKNPDRLDAIAFLVKAMSMTALTGRFSMRSGPNPNSLPKTEKIAKVTEVKTIKP